MSSAPATRPAMTIVLRGRRPLRCRVSEAIMVESEFGMRQRIRRRSADRATSPQASWPIVLARSARAAPSAIEHAHPADASVTLEVHSLIEPLRRFVAGVDFEVERDAAAVARDLHRCFDELLAEAVAATRGLDVHLVEPRGRTAVLQRP